MGWNRKKTKSVQLNFLCHTASYLGEFTYFLVTLKIILNMAGGSGNFGEKGYDWIYNYLVSYRFSIFKRGDIEE
jgi:uncharacterized membrane protein YjdF